MAQVVFVKVPVTALTTYKAVATAGQTDITPTNPAQTGVWVFRGGIKQVEGTDYDFTVAGGKVIFNYPLEAGERVEVVA